MGSLIHFPGAQEAWLPSKQIAAHYGVHVKTVQAWVREGMPHMLLGGRTKRFRVSECDAWHASRAKGA